MKILKQAAGTDISMDKSDIRFATPALNDNTQFKHTLYGQSAFASTPEGFDEFRNRTLTQKIFQLHLSWKLPVYTRKSGLLSC